MLKHHDRLFLLAAALLGADRLLKRLALAGMEAGSEAARFVLFRNEGIAFSLPFSGPLIWLLSGVIIAVVILAAASDFRRGRLARAGAYALFGLGAASNLFDRVAYGFTVDYLVFFGRSAVNLADGMIVAGALLLLLSDRKR